MKSDEVFYLHIDGDERGPYTVPQIDHLLNSGLISEQTLFWREGMEQWSPVTELVVRREQPKRNWRRTGIVLGCLFFLFLIFARVFGPTTIMGWREAAQTDFTSEAAYWRAREVVRSNALPPGSVVVFHAFKSAQVKLEEDTSAAVVLKGDVTHSKGNTQVTTWKVQLVYNPRLKEWTGRQVQQLEPAP